MQKLQRQEFGGASTLCSVLLLGFRVLACLLAEVPELLSNTLLHARLTSQASGKCVDEQSCCL